MSDPLVVLAAALARSEGGAYLVVQASGRNILRAVHELVEGSLHPSDGAAMRAARQLLGDRRLTVCRLRLNEWEAYPKVTLQAVLSLELARSVPGVDVPSTPERLTAAELTSALGRHGDGVVILAPEVDVFLASRHDPGASLRFLDQLAAAVGVYLLPLWVIATAESRLIIPGNRFEILADSHSGPPV